MEYTKGFPNNLLQPGGVSFCQGVLYFYIIEFLPITGWVTLHPFSRVCFLKPLANPYEDWKDKYFHVRGCDNMSHVFTGAGGEPLFLISWTPDPKFIVRVDSLVLSPLDREVIQVMECICPME